MAALESRISGTVLVQFEVRADGKIENIKIVKGIGSGCDEEVIRVVRLMPKWNPGKIGGMKVAVVYNLPVKFRFNEEPPVKKDKIKK